MKKIEKTKRVLQRELVRLLKDQPIQTISIKTLCEACGLNRSTFYLHYPDIYALYDDFEKNLLEDFSAMLAKNITGTETSYQPVLKALYKYIADNKDVILFVFEQMRSTQFFSKLYEVGRNFYQNNLPANANVARYYYDYVASATIGVVQAWIASGMEESPEEMSRLTGSFIESGMPRL